MNSDPCAVMLVWWNQRIGIPKKKNDEKVGGLGEHFCLVNEVGVSTERGWYLHSTFSKCWLGYKMFSKCHVYA